VFGFPNGASLTAPAHDGRDVLSGGRDNTEVVGKYTREKSGNFAVYLKSNFPFSSEFNLIIL
jgi:hypothetical protein